MSLDFEDEDTPWALLDGFEFVDPNADGDS